MELTLWRWSIGVQISSLVLIGAFFLVLQRSLPRDAIASWVRGWVFNFLALGAALLYWMMEPTPGTQAFAFFLFVAMKDLAVLYMVQGAWSLHQAGVQLVGGPSSSWPRSSSLCSAPGPSRPSICSAPGSSSSSV